MRARPTAGLRNLAAGVLTLAAGVAGDPPDPPTVGGSKQVTVEDAPAADSPKEPTDSSQSNG